MRYASWIVGSSSLIVCSVSRMRVFHCVSLDRCMQYCIPWFSSSCSSVVKLMCVRLMVRCRTSVVGCGSRVCGVCGSLLVGCPVFLFSLL